MEQALGTLLSAGPLGILCAVLLIGLAGAVVAWRAAESRLLEKTEKSAEALTASTEVLRAAADTREVMTAAMESMTTALRESTQLQTEMLARADRALVISDLAQRTMADVQRIAVENSNRLQRLTDELVRLERTIALLERAATVGPRRGGA